jgi:hypothetical protein
VNKYSFILLFFKIIFSYDNSSFYNGLGIELTQNGAGIYYEPEIMGKIDIYSKFGLHFERSNTLEINPLFNTQNPGFKKTIGALSIGTRVPLIQNYFYNNMSIHLLAELGIGNEFNSLMLGKLNDENNRILTGLSLQIPGGKIIKRYDICFQSNSNISGIFLIRFHFLRKLINNG